MLLDAALLDDGPASEDEVASTTPEAVEPWCASHDAEPPSITSISPQIVPRNGGRVLIHVARCDAGYALIDGRRVAFDSVTHVGGRLQAFVDIPKARPAQRFEAIVVVRSDGARSDACLLYTSPSPRD